MQSLDSSIGSMSAQTTEKPAIDAEVSTLPVSGDGRPKMPIQLDVSDHSGSAQSEALFPEPSVTFESIEEKRPIRTVTWNVEEVKQADEDQEETLSMLGRRKLKAWRKKVLAEKRKEEKKSWKLWLWSQGCPCLDWSPMYLFQGNDDQSSMAACDQSTVHTDASTFVTVDDDGENVADDDSSIPSCSRVGSTLDESTIEDDENISDVSSNSSDGTLEEEEDEGEDEEEKLETMVKPPKPKIEAKPMLEVSIEKDWSREGLSTNTIGDMDVYIEAMRS